MDQRNRTPGNEEGGSACASGQRAVALGGSVSQSVILTGDNNTVNFERTLIFLTSNLGSHGMMKELNPQFGFAGLEAERGEMSSRLTSIAMRAARRQFTPEFMNRIDAIVTYQPLSSESLAALLE